VVEGVFEGAGQLPGCGFADTPGRFRWFECRVGVQHEGVEGIQG
jgi:hypothetical protein